MSCDAKLCYLRCWSHTLVNLRALTALPPPPPASPPLPPPPLPPSEGLWRTSGKPLKGPSEPSSRAP
eukprot:8689246-Pyramimonas_sp.AAC.1